MGRADVINRKCHACKREFPTTAGSLLRLCDREDCRRTRVVGAGYEKAGGHATTNAQAHLRALLLREPGMRELRPEAVETLDLAARMDVPTITDFAQAIRKVKNARGHLERREVLLHMSALCLRWAGSLPKTQTLERAGTVDAETPGTRALLAHRNGHATRPR